MRERFGLSPEQVRLLRSVVSAFEGSGTSYAAVGAIARNAYARNPRPTRDFDFVVSGRRLGRLVEGLRGTGFREVFLTPAGRRAPLAADSLRERLDRSFAHLPHSGLPHAIDLIPSRGRFYPNLLRRARRVSWGGRVLRVATPEDYVLATSAMVQIAKEIGASELHDKIAKWEEDVREVREATGNRLDTTYLGRWRVIR